MSIKAKKLKEVINNIPDDAEIFFEQGRFYGQETILTVHVLTMNRIKQNFINITMKT